MVRRHELDDWQGSMMVAQADHFQIQQKKDLLIFIGMIFLLVLTSSDQEISIVIDGTYNRHSWI